MVVEVLGVAWFALLVFALLWKYGGLPDLDWKFFQVGFLFFFLGVFVGILETALGGVGMSFSLGLLVSLLNLLGALAVVVAVLQNLAASLGK